MLSVLLNRRKLLSDKKLFGRWGEKRCRKFLAAKGLRKLASNYCCKTGEIDLIMVDASGAIVFVEVKTRRDESFTAAEDVITAPKRLRMTRTARYFLSSYDIQNRPYRFDVVTVVLGEKGPPQIKHYENAFVA
jgi:putative endonuclease